MKKFLIILIFIVFISGCNKKVDETDKIDNNDTFVLTKNDDSKDYVYLENYKELYYDNNLYNLQILVVNVKSDEVDNVNLELKSFVSKSYKDMIINDDLYLTRGYIIGYDYYVIDDYISVIQKYYLYIDGLFGEENDNVYVISLNTGKTLSNDELLNEFNFTEEEFYNYLESNIESDDIKYTLMKIKNNGYNLYVNSDGKLVVLYYEETDAESIKKEFVIE